MAASIGAALCGSDEIARWRAADVVRLPVRFAKLPMASDDACHGLSVEFK
jgi:hypothetical protein